MDNLMFYARNRKEWREIVVDSNELFYQNDIRETKRILDKYNVSYIFISEELFDGRVWDEENKGLHFLLQNRETFKNIYSSEEVGIWEYKND